jgi:hypothetical protein
VYRRPVADDRKIGSLMPDPRFTKGDIESVAGVWSFREELVVQELGLQEERRAPVAHRRTDHPDGIIGERRNHDTQPRQCGKHGFEVL